MRRDTNRNREYEHLTRPDMPVAEQARLHLRATPEPFVGPGIDKDASAAECEMTIHEFSKFLRELSVLLRGHL